jgi:hypothetical protein
MIIKRDFAAEHAKLACTDLDFKTRLFSLVAASNVLSMMKQAPLFAIQPA